MKKQMVRYLLLGFLLAGLWGWLAPPLAAHQDDLSIATVTLERRDADVTLTLPTSLLAGFDDNRDGRLVPAELQRHQEQLIRFLAHRFALWDEGERPGEITAVTLSNLEVADLPPEAQLTRDTHTTLVITYRWPEVPQSLTIRYALFQTSLQDSLKLPQDHCILTIRQGSQAEKTLLSSLRREVTVPLQATAGTPLPWSGQSWPIALGAAFLWGAAHALSPGHGKTALSAYLVGAKATPGQALLLGAMTALTHTVGVFVLGALLWSATAFVDLDRILPWLGVLSGAAITAIGANLCRDRLHRLTAHRARHPHHHHHHPVPTAATWQQLTALGISGGLVPCPAALVLLLGTVGLGQTARGLLLVAGFSLGLALTLAGLGMLLVCTKKWSDRLPARNRFFQEQLPVASAAVVALVGLAIALRGLQQI